MRQIICIGSACKDIFFPTGEGHIIETPKDILSQKKIQFELGAKYKIEDRHETIGGCAANVAVGMSKLGVDASCYSHLGNDKNADWILEELELEGVRTDLIRKDEELPSDMSAIIVDKDSGERIIFSNQKANGKLTIVKEEIEDAEWYFIGDLHGNWEEDLEDVVETAVGKKIKIIFNPRQSNIHDDAGEILKAIPFSEILILNKDEAMELISKDNEGYTDQELTDEKFLLTKIKELGAVTVVITDGTNGAWAANDENKIWAGAMLTEAADSTGAGDAFTSGFSAAYIKGKDLSECLSWGIANSSSSVKFFGGTEGLLKEDEIMKMIDGVKTEEII